MKKSLYKVLKRKIILITLLVSFAPLFLLGWVIYEQFSEMYVDRMRDQIMYRATSHSNSIELFLKERTAVLSSMADTLSFNYVVQPQNLSRMFEIINVRAGGLVDLGVIDSMGNHLAYVGPYELEGRNYYQQPWFAQVMNRGIYISDVYMGFRKLPHFIIAVRRQEEGHSWILRATIDSEVFIRLVRTAQIGKTGDAYIINKEGFYQTSPRFGNKVLEQSGIDTSQFGQGTSLMEMKNSQGNNVLYAGSWMKNSEWLLIISQNPDEGMSKIAEARNREIAIILFGCIAIILTTVFTTRMSIRRLEERDQKMDELNAQLIQTDKLAALGKMAAGVAHEINNPLAVISEKAGWMEDLLEEEEFQESENLQEYQNSLRKIQEHVERARKVTHNMLGFARKMEPHLEEVNINAVLNQTLDLLENHARINNIDLQTDFQSDLPIILSDQAQLQQVFLNLINNAIDAIGKDGLVQIRTRKADSMIAISVEDNGPGISEKLQGKIFDPFFTTKPTGKGTGLGLSVSFNIMQKMGGTITVSSKEGKGSIFTVSVPVVLPESR